MTRPSFGRRTAARIVFAAVAAIMITIGLAPAASAHVRLSATDASPGGYGLLTFRVPTESDTATTTEIVINFPEHTPITSVSTAPVTGWTATVVTRKLDKPVQTDDGPVSSYVTRVDWKADSARSAIPSGQFGLFNLTAGPLPKAATVAFPTDQHYSDGTVVAWNQLQTGSAEPDHPAPLLQLGTPSTATPAPGATDTAPASNGTDPLGVIAVALAAVGVVIAVMALLRTRRPTA